MRFVGGGHQMTASDQVNGVVTVEAANDFVNFRLLVSHVQGKTGREMGRAFTAAVRQDR